MSRELKVKAWDKLNEEWIHIKSLNLWEDGELWYVEDFDEEVYFSTDNKAMMIHRCINEDLRVLDWVDDNDDLFIRAWLDGYSVEKEPQWVVKTGKNWFFKNFESVGEYNYQAIGTGSIEEAKKFKYKMEAESVALLSDGEVEEIIK